MAHTPGPWMFDASTGDVYQNDHDLLRQIAAIDFMGSEFPDNVADDIRLMLAAPALLEALQAAVMQLRAKGVTNSDELAVITMVEDAIKSATA